MQGRAGEWAQARCHMLRDPVKSLNDGNRAQGVRPPCHIHTQKGLQGETSLLARQVPSALSRKGSSACCACGADWR